MISALAALAAIRPLPLAAHDYADLQTNSPDIFIQQPNNRLFLSKTLAFSEVHLLKNRSESFVTFLRLALNRATGVGSFVLLSVPLRIIPTTIFWMLKNLFMVYGSMNVPLAPCYMRNTLFLKIIATTLVFGALLVFYPATIILGAENSSQFTGLWKRQSSGAPLGLAYSSDGRNYVAFLRPLTCITGPETTIENWVCRIRFSLYDTCPPGPRAFIIAPSSIARPMGVSQGRGDWEGYKPACYDQGAITDGQAHILKAGWEWFALIDWRVRWMKNKEPRQAANSSLLSLLPADKEQAESIARTMGLRGDTPEWLDFQTVLKELKNQRYRLVTGKTAARQPADPEKVTVMLRHDVDVSLYGAQIMAFEEALHAIPAVFCINLGSSIYGLTGNNGVYIHRPGALEDLLTLQQLGHIISSRTDSLVMQGIYATPLSNWRNAEHQRMLAAGVQDIALPLSNSVTHPLRTIADTQAGQGQRLDFLLRSLRESKPGDVLEIILHPRLWTTNTPEFDLSMQNTALRLALSR